MPRTACTWHEPRSSSNRPSAWCASSSRSRRARRSARGSRARLSEDDFLFPSRQHESPHLSTHQYGRIVKRWITLIGGDPQGYGTHSLRRTRATLIYRKTKNLRAVQLLLGHTKIESTVRYLGIEVDDALEMAECVEC
jgi:integrase